MLGVMAAASCRRRHWDRLETGVRGQKSIALRFLAGEELMSVMVRPAKFYLDLMISAWSWATPFGAVAPHAGGLDGRLDCLGPAVHRQGHLIAGPTRTTA